MAMAGSDEDDAVYASILARVERSELHEQCHRVARKECRSIGRQVRKATASLTALRQLQAAAQHLRPSGDWLPGRLQAQLKSVQELQSRLQTAVDRLEDGVRDRRTKKRKRPSDKQRWTILEGKEDAERDRYEHVDRRREGEDSTETCSGLEAVEKDKRAMHMEDAEEEVEFLEVVAPPAGTRKEVAERVKMESTEAEVAAEGVVESVLDEGVPESQVAVDEDREQTAVVTSEGDELPNGLVRTRDLTVRVKEEIVSSMDEQIRFESSSEVVAVAETVASEIAESPLELEVLESSEESAREQEAYDTDEVAIELEVPDSESEDDFSPCVEMTTKLRKARAATQLAEFPVVVEQLRSYLFECKHLAVVELDGYIFAHKRITDNEVDEIGRAIETVIAVGISLPRRPRIKLALHDLLDMVEQLELTLGELPAFLSPVTKKLSDYFIMHIQSTVDKGTRSGQTRFTELQRRASLS